jgi:general secretion pathway protein G
VFHAAHPRRLRPDHRPAGFTLVEILIVVLILGILAGIVVPQITTASQESRRNALKGTLYRVRQQLQLYKQEHSAWPNDFLRQMTQPTDRAGNTPANPGNFDRSQFRFGPYLQTAPTNPFTGGKKVTQQGDAGTSDWYYDPETGTFKANDTEAHRAF